MGSYPGNVPVVEYPLCSHLEELSVFPMLNVLVFFSVCVFPDAVMVLVIVIDVVKQKDRARKLNE